MKVTFRRGRNKKNLPILLIMGSPKGKNLRVFFNLHEWLSLWMRIFFSNEAGDMLIKAMQITALKAQPWRRGPKTATMADSSLSFNFQQIGRGQDKGAGITFSVLAAGTRDGARVMDTSLHNGVLIDAVLGKS